MEHHEIPLAKSQQAMVPIPQVNMGCGCGGTVLPHGASAGRETHHGGGEGIRILLWQIRWWPRLATAWKRNGLMLGKSSHFHMEKRG